MEKVTWPGWEATQLIGTGSFGSVYEIHRDHFGVSERAALKTISIPQSKGDIDELVNDGYDISDITERYETYLKDIVGEYSLMAQLKGHSNIVYCDDLNYCKHDDGIGWDIYIKMELLTPLPKILPQNISEELVIKLGQDMCKALIACKELNIVHRDIKPQNIFVSKDGTYKLGDFGIAKTAERTTAGTKIGTYKYMAPEVYKSEPYGTAADIYSLGLVMYWLLNERRTPFLPLPPQVPTAQMEDDARRRRFMGEQLPPPAHGSEVLKKIVLKACAYDPKDRYHSADELLAALNDLSAAPAEPVIAAAPAEEDDSTRGIFHRVPVSQEEPSLETEETCSGTVGVFSSQPDVPVSSTTEDKEDATNQGIHTLARCFLAVAAVIIGFVILLVPLSTSRSNYKESSTYRAPVESIEILSLPNQTVYNSGDLLKTEGLSIIAHHEDNSKRTVSNGLTVTPRILRTLGNKTIIVSYHGKQTTFDVLVK